MPTARWEMAACAVDGKIYAFGGLGGLAKVEEYDPATDTWTSKTDMPTGRSFLECSVIDDKIYVIGGNDSEGGWGASLATVEVYDPATDTWTKKADMSTVRDGAGVSFVNGKLYAMGGSEVHGFQSWSTLRSVEEYDPLTDTWTPKTDMYRARETFSAIVVGEKIYAIGSFAPYEEMYDPAIDTWAKIAPMPSPRIHAPALAVDSRIYVFGGDEEGGGPGTSVVFTYDPKTDTWETLNPMPFEGLGMSAVLVDGKVYIIGGSKTNSPPHLATVWEYVPELLTE